MDSQDISKKAAAEKACGLVEDGMKVGLGTGSTAEWAIKRLGERVREEKLDIVGVPSSIRTRDLAKIVKIPIIPYHDFIHEDIHLDINIDGADRIDPEFRLIKGGGGAHAREKQVALRSKLFCCVADEGKLVPKLIGSFPLPVEVIPDYYVGACRELSQFGHVKRRETEGKVFITDGSNYVVDISLSVGEPDRLEVDINRIPGVVDNGFFTVQRPQKVFIGNPDGSVKVLDANLHSP
jgi:ribose 5-phosphate isomerase A